MFSICRCFSAYLQIFALLNSVNDSFISSKNILCVYKLIYGVGLRTLRRLFMDINPNWSNQPSDAAAFDKGKMKLSTDEQVSFNKGNIKEWDFSLMTTTLLYSKSCVLEIVKRPGYETALKELKKCRNKLLGHPSTDTMSDTDFGYYWPLLSKHFITLGADPKVISDMEFGRGNEAIKMANSNDTRKVLDRVLNQSNFLFYRHPQFPRRKIGPTIIHISMHWRSF